MILLSLETVGSTLILKLDHNDPQIFHLPYNWIIIVSAFDNKTYKYRVTHK